MTKLENQGYDLMDHLFLPKLTDTDVLLIIQQASKIFSEEPVILNISTDIICVGDLHGHIFDLFRIFNTHGLPPFSRYLILGDIVDRGEFSMETLILLLLLKCNFPDFIYIIRGNHEFENICSCSGLLEEITHSFSSTVIFDEINSLFNLLPIGARIYDKLFCIHAGIGPSFLNINSLSSLDKPITSFETPILSPAVWSDPSSDRNGFVSSPRGQGFLFGSDALQAFCNKNNVQVLIRGHQCVDGINVMFDNHLYTVFSASNYCGQCTNRSGILLISLSDINSILSTSASTTVSNQDVSNQDVSNQNVSNQNVSNQNVSNQNVLNQNVSSYNSLPPLKQSNIEIDSSLLQQLQIPTSEDDTCLIRSSKSVPHSKLTGSMNLKPKPIPRPKKSPQPPHKKQNSIYKSNSSTTFKLQSQNKLGHSVGNCINKAQRASLIVNPSKNSDIPLPPPIIPPHFVEWKDGKSIEISSEIFTPIRYIHRCEVLFVDEAPID